MNLRYRYLDHLPKLPIGLESNISSFSQDDVQDINYIKNKTIHYSRWNVSSDVAHWVSDHITPDFLKLGVQIHDRVDTANKHNPHTDKTRAWVLMYCIQPGGDAVTTSWYQEQHEPMMRELGIYTPDIKAPLTKIESVIVEPRRWFLLNSRIIHAVENITGKRISLAVSLSDQAVVNLLYPQAKKHD
jgi:hypothetical protein